MEQLETLLGHKDIFRAAGQAEEQISVSKKKLEELEEQIRREEERIEEKSVLDQRIGEKEKQAEALEPEIGKLRDEIAGAQARKRTLSDQAEADAGELYCGSKKEAERRQKDLEE